MCDHANCRDTVKFGFVLILFSFVSEQLRPSFWFRAIKMTIVAYPRKSKVTHDDGHIRVTRDNLPNSCRDVH